MTTPAAAAAGADSSQAETAAGAVSHDDKTMPASSEHRDSGELAQYKTEEDT